MHTRIYSYYYWNSSKQNRLQLQLASLLPSFPLARNSTGVRSSSLSWGEHEEDETPFSVCPSSSAQSGCLPPTLEFWIFIIFGPTYAGLMLGLLMLGLCCPSPNYQLLIKLVRLKPDASKVTCFWRLRFSHCAPPPFFLPGIAFLHKVGRFCGRLTCWIFLIASCCILNLFLCSPCFLCPGCQPLRLD